MKLVSTEEVLVKFETDFNNCSIRYGDMKKQLAEDMIAFMKPIREKASDIQNNKELLNKITRQGADKARASASATIQLVRKAVLG